MFAVKDLLIKLSRERRDVCQKVQAQEKDSDKRW